MTITLLAVTAFATLATAAFVGWQAVEMRRNRQISDWHHHDARKPTFRPEVEPVNDGEWHRLWIILTKPEALDSLEVTILEPQIAWFPSGQTGVEPGQRRKVASWGKVVPGKRDVAYRIEWSDDKSHLAHLSLRSTRGTESWDTLIEVELPAKPYDLLDSIG